MKTILLILSFSISNLLPKHDSWGFTNDHDWYPLSVGNVWAYENFYNENGTIHFLGYSWEIIRDVVTLSNGQKYFEILSHKSDGSIDTLFLRLDSLVSIIYGYDKNSENELLYEDLSAGIGDTVCYEYNPYWFCQVVREEVEFSIWRLLTQKKYFSTSEIGWQSGHFLIKGIGLFSYGSGDLYSYGSNLIGCKIDGVEYGGISVVNIEKQTEKVPPEFFLYQNYPNPFNPSTKIKFTIPSTENPLLGGARGGLVTLKVYDVLGNEVATLVNENKPAGSYETEFRIENGELASGIYFYQLVVGDFLQTKKMMFLR